MLTWPEHLITCLKVFSHFVLNFCYTLRVRLKSSRVKGFRISFQDHEDGRYYLKSGHELCTHLRYYCPESGTNLNEGEVMRV